MPTTPASEDARTLKRAAKLAAKISGATYQACHQMLAGTLPFEQVMDADTLLDVLELLVTYGTGAPDDGENLDDRPAEYAFDLARQLPASVIPTHVACDPDELVAWLHARAFQAA
jgi:hypothetical protein